MRRVARWIVGALPLDERGRRAMDETLADWAHEAAQAAGPIARAAGTARALLAIARTLLLLTARDTWRIPVGWTVGRLLPVLVVSSLALTIKTSTSVLGSTVWHGHPSLLGWLALNLSPLAFPWAGLVAIATTARRRPLPLMGLAAFGMAMSLVLVGWIGPDSRLYFRESAYQVFAGVPPPYPFTRGVQEMRPGGLLSLALTGGERWSRIAIDMLLLHASLVIACPLMVFLAGRLRLANWSLRALAIASFPVALVLSVNGRVDIRLGLILAFVGSLALTWRLPGRDERASAS